MPVAVALVLTASERHRIKRLARSRTLPHQQVLRAQIVRLAACGKSNASVASVLHLKTDTVRKWRGRFAAHGLDGLKDLPRSGRPRRFSALQRAEVKALACALPATRGVPLSRWTSTDLADEVVAAGIAASMSASTVRRILAKDAIKPWQYRSWISVRDPNFTVKVIVLELYQRRWQGQPLAADEYVISSDEKTSSQARCRCHPTLPPGRSRPMRVEHDYDRGGALAYLAAYDVHAGTVIGRCAPSTGIEQFHALVDQVMNTEPYRSATRVFWVVDNGSSHRGQAATDRLAAGWPNCVLVHTPVHASWLNQVEIFFSSTQRKSYHRTTSPTSTRSDSAWQRSSSATTPPPPRSTGSSPPTTSTTSWPDSTSTRPKRPRPPQRDPHELLGRTTVLRRPRRCAPPRPPPTCSAGNAGGHGTHPSACRHRTREDVLEDDGTLTCRRRLDVILHE